MQDRADSTRADRLPAPAVESRAARPRPETGEAGSAPGRRPRRSWLVLAPVALFAGVAILFALALGRGDPSKLPSALIGKPVPAFTLPAVEGLVAGGRPVPGFAAADLARGAPTVVNFWASWCAPCVEEHQLLVELGKRTGVTIVGANYKDQPEAARRFLARHGNPFTAVGADVNGRIAIEWGVYGMPETFVVDGRGTIVMKHVGPLSADSLERRVIPAIEEARRR